MIHLLTVRSTEEFYPELEARNITPSQTLMASSEVERRNQQLEGLLPFPNLILRGLKNTSRIQ
jgi:hypothetical protein